MTSSEDLDGRGIKAIISRDAPCTNPDIAFSVCLYGQLFSMVVVDCVDFRSPKSEPLRASSSSSSTTGGSQQEPQSFFTLSINRTRSLTLQSPLNTAIMPPRVPVRLLRTHQISALRTSFRQQFQQPFRFQRRYAATEAAAVVEETGFAKFWNSKVGPKTVHFW